ncbi:hypothetical protein MKW94_018545 [Papaver nudicaule]|uniref:Uncharacterized protein n=1 Tax=Papaver nudicaule TaxID=74823 RepID=A0AA42B1L7_PAPNU|nr:hypothetical protein [Papaver nudicaule]
MDLERRAGEFAGSILAYLTWEDQFPYYVDTIHDYKDDLKNYPADTPTEVINDCTLKLCRSLVHSKDKNNVKEGIRKLKDGYDGVLGVLSPLQRRDMLYLLAVGCYEEKDYPSSLSYLDQCLEIAPHFNQALTLKKRFGSVLGFLIGGDHQHYLDMILDCERDIAEAGDDIPDEVKNEHIIKLSWALVHTRETENVQRGMAMVEAPLGKSELNQLQYRDMIYIRALGHYMSGDFYKSWKDIYRCLEITPDFWQGWKLYVTAESRMEKNEFLGALIHFTAAGFLLASIISYHARHGMA